MTWLYLPGSSCAPALECSAKAQGPHSSFLGTTTEPFATWNGKPLLPASLSRLWKRERLIRRLSGLTCSRSTAQRGADAWLASLPASRARTCLSPVNGQGWTEREAACSSLSAPLPTLAKIGRAHV